MSCCEHSAPSRRAVLAGAVVGGGMAWAGQASAGGQAEVVLLSCMDYRLANEVEAYMAARGLRDNYDHLIVAGASIGVNQGDPAWGKTFWEHVGLARKLHNVRKLIVIDHRDCGAYKLLAGEAAVATPELELAAHVKQLHAFRDAVKQRHPELEVELALMSLDGRVEMIA